MKFDWRSGELTWGPCWYVFLYPNWLKKENRHLGPYTMFYDQPHYAFGFWWFNVSWSTPWNKWDH